MAAHTHLMSLAVIFFCLSIIFSFCGVGQKMKAFFMPLPFLALFLDFGARALIKYVPSFVYVMAAAGALMALSMMVLTLGPLYEITKCGYGDVRSQMSLNHRTGQPELIDGNTETNCVLGATVVMATI